MKGRFRSRKRADGQNNEVIKAELREKGQCEASEKQTEVIL